MGLGGMGLGGMGHGGSLFENESNRETGLHNLLKSMFKQNEATLPKGKDILKLVNITLEDIFLGNTYILTYDTQIINNNYEKCFFCKGKGKIQVMQQLGPMEIQSIDYCNKCNGQGYLNLYLPNTGTIEFEIERGFNYNEKKLILDKGLPLFNGDNGDLILSFNLQKHPKFKLKNNDLHASMDITFKESLIGFIKGFHHLDSRLLTISSDDIIKPNTIRLIEHEGMYDIKTGTYGNLYIKFKIIYPNSLTKEQHKIIENNF